MRDVDLIRRVLEQVQIPPGCWEWKGTRTPEGYGRYSGDMAHRLTYEYLVGPIPGGLEIDHLCKNKSCVRPDHLEPVTRWENNMRAGNLTLTNSQKTHCPRGHIYAGSNVGYAAKPNGRKARYCRTCKRDQTREYMRSRRRR